jgi:hypothetical protein
MAVVDINSQLAARNPEALKATIMKGLLRLAEDTVMLAMIRDSAMLRANPSANAVEALEIVQQRMSDTCDELMGLVS